MKIRSLYITSHEKSAGSLVVTMGIMEFLKARFGRVAFFRPFVKSKERDHNTHFFINRFSLDMEHHQTFAFSVLEAEREIAQNRFKFLLKGIISKVKRLEESYDFLLIEGLNQDNFSNAIDFDINLEVSKNLDMPYINILKGNNKSADEILDEILIDYEGIKLSGCKHFATFANRIDKDTSRMLKELLLHYDNLPPVFILEEISELDMPTIQEVKDTLGCEVVRANELDFRRVVKDIKIAAMQLDDYLEHIEDGDLIVVPADRADIITGSILAIYSKRFPTISGIVLTGTISISPSIKDILDGFNNLPLPIFSIPLDTFQTAIQVNQVSAMIDYNNERKIALAMGLFHSSVDSRLLETEIKKSSSSILTPAMFEYALFHKAIKSKKRIVLPESLDDRVLRASEILLRRDVVDIILLGDEEKIGLKSAFLGLDISKATIINPKTSSYKKAFAEELYRLRKEKGMTLEASYDIISSVSYFATMMVHMDLADGMVSGAIHTTQETIRPALQIIKTKPNIPIVSSLFFMSLDTKVLVYADCAVNQDPTAKELATIAINSADTAMQFGITPKIAMLSYSTGSSGKGKDVQKVAEATKIVKERRAELPIEGPIQYDAAIDREVAKKKLPDSKVAGEATIFIFPDLNTGNNTYKAVQRSSGAVAIGPILQGLKKPINDLSRGCLVADIVNTVVITAIQAVKEKI